MSKFFRSEIVQKELEKMQELYLEINRMGLVLSVDEKRDQLQKMLELINVQQTMYMRVTLSEDPDAKQLVQQVKQAATMLGMPPATLFATPIAGTSCIPTCVAMGTAWCNVLLRNPPPRVSYAWPSTNPPPPMYNAWGNGA